MKSSNMGVVLPSLMLAARMLCPAQPVEPVTITVHPVDQVVQAGHPVTFEVQATGTALRYQWFTNGARLIGATSSSYTNLATAPAMNGIAFHVVVSNLVSVSTSRVAVLTVTPDTTGPRPLFAYAVSSNRLDAHFDERVLFTSASPSVSNFSIAILGSTNTFRITNLQWGLTLLRMTANGSFSPTGNYVLCMSNVMDTYTNLMTPNPACLPIGIPTTNLLISPGAIWRFNEVAAPEPAWRSRDYNDDPEEPPYHWTEGWGGFRYSASPGSLCWPMRTSLSIGPAAYYFRKRFVVNDEPGTNATLLLNHLIDDGAVFYLNDTEVLRVRMPSGTINHSTPAVHIPDASCTVTQATVGDLLVRGTNVLAVEVHQAVESSPQLNDAAFELEMKLRFFRMPSIPALRIVHRVGEVEFQWESGWVLEASETIAGPWVKIVTPASEYISPVGQSARRFFRLADR